MPSFSAGKTIVVGLVTGAAGLLIGNEWKEKLRVKASWTTHHNTPEPLYKWDTNWDK